MVLLKIGSNVRRYVALAQSRGGACFCTRGAMQGYDVVLFILALAKTVTPVGVPGGSRGRPWRQPQNHLLFTQLSRHGAPMTYTDLLGLVLFKALFYLCSGFFG